MFKPFKTFQSFKPLRIDLNDLNCLNGLNPRNYCAPKIASSRFGDRALQNALTGGAVEGGFDEGILFLERLDQGGDRLVVQRVVEDDFAFGSGGLFDRRCHDKRYWE
jgi:hypothetical protein